MWHECHDCQHLHCQNKPSSATTHHTQKHVQQPDFKYRLILGVHSLSRLHISGTEYPLYYISKPICSVSLDLKLPATLYPRTLRCCNTNTVFIGSMYEMQNCWYVNDSGVILSFLPHRGNMLHRAVKFGSDESKTSNFTTIGAWVGCGSQKLKILHNCRT